MLTTEHIADPGERVAAPEAPRTRGKLLGIIPTVLEPWEQALAAKPARLAALRAELALVQTPGYIEPVAPPNSELADLPISSEVAKGFKMLALRGRIADLEAGGVLRQEFVEFGGRRLYVGERMDISQIATPV